MLRAIGVAVLGLILVGCAAGREASDQRVGVDALPPAGLTRIIFFRPGSLALAWRDAQISVNDRRACSLSNGDAFAYDTMPGDLSITAKRREQLFARPVVLHAAADQVYYVQVAGALDSAPVSSYLSVTIIGGKPSAATFNASTVKVCPAA